MERFWPLLIVGTGLWTAAVGLAVVASLTGSLVVALWSALAALKAVLVSLWVIMETIATRERLRVEELAQVIAAGMIEARGVAPIRH